MPKTIIWKKKSQVLVTVNFQYLLIDHIKGCMYRFVNFSRDDKWFSLLGLNVTNYVSAYCNILIRSALSRSVEATGSSAIIKRLVSSANTRMQQPILLTMSFMKIRKSNDPSIETCPCWTTANIFDQSEQPELPWLIPRNSVESDHGCTSSNAVDNMTLTLFNVALTSQKPY